MTPQDRQPVFNAPAVVIGLIAVFAAIHLARQWLQPVTDDWVITTFAFIPARFTEAGSQWPAPAWAAPVSLIAHTLLHGDWMHLIVNSAWMLAVGTPVARRMATIRFMALAALCGIGGAALFMVMNAGLDRPMVGASGAISGLMAAVFRLMFAADKPYDRYVLREHPIDAPRLSLAETFRRRNSALAILVWVVINIVFAYGFGALESPGGIAWEAHLGGFFTGLFAFALFDQGRTGSSNGSGEDFDERE